MVIIMILLQADGKNYIEDILSCYEDGTVEKEKLLKFIQYHYKRQG